MERNKEKQKTYINKWQKENRKRIVVLATLEEYNSINQQAQANNLSITRYLIECHNKNVLQEQHNTIEHNIIQEHNNNQNTTSHGNQSTNKGITFNR